MTFSSSRIIKAGIVSQSVGVKSFELPSMAADTNGKGKSPVFPDFYLNTSAEEALPDWQSVYLNVRSTRSLNNPDSPDTGSYPSCKIQ